jgi:predicted DNA-binding transcriptional regulator YafY
MSKTDRVYKIELLIRNRGHVSFSTLLEELEVSRATLKRDLEFLKDRLGAPIVYDRFVNGYKFAEDHPRGVRRHELPGLWFDERELYSLLMAHQLLSELDADGVIARHLQPLLDRIHALLGPDEPGAKTLLARVRIIHALRRPVAGRCFERVVDALLQRRRLALRYLTRSRGEVSEREVSPQRLVHHRNAWYLDAWCHRSDGLRRFALDAIEQAELRETKAREVSAAALREAMDAGYGIYAGARRHWATLRFEPVAAQWVSREEWHPDQRGRWLEDGRWELQVPYVDETELAMDLLRHGGQVQVMAPASLRERVLRQHREALALHGG